MLIDVKVQFAIESISFESPVFEHPSVEVEFSSIPKGLINDTYIDVDMAREDYDKVADYCTHIVNGDGVQRMRFDKEFGFHKLFFKTREPARISHLEIQYGKYKTHLRIWYTRGADWDCKVKRILIADRKSTSHEFGFINETAARLEYFLERWVKKQLDIMIKVAVE